MKKERQEENPKKKKTKWIIILLLLLIITSIITTTSYISFKENKEKEKQKEETINNINNHYSTNVQVVKDTTIYKDNNGTKEKIGTISKGQILTLEKEKITENTKYFYNKELDIYISYKDVEPTDEEVVVNKRYKNYLLFDENVVTKKEVHLIENNQVAYTLYESLDKPIIKKEDDGYYIEYYNRLFFISNEDVERTYETINNDKEEANTVPVTCYHFIYLGAEDYCDEVICHSKDQIESHFKYLTENNYFTITTTELRYFIEGKLRLPKHSILVTIDDGARAEKFIPLLEEYNIHATLFLVSSWYDKKTFSSPYMEIASHTHDLHTGGKCPGGQGGWIKCLEHDKLLEDFTKSRETLDGTEAFCYPFYEYNNYTISVLKEAGFKMGFAGGQKRVEKGIDLFQIPRITIMRDTTLDEYINYVK